MTALSELSDVSTGPPAESVPPKFTQLLKDIEGSEGQMVCFECRVIGHPTPEVKWYRGRQKIENSPDFQVKWLAVCQVCSPIQLVVNYMHIYLPIIVAILMRCFWWDGELDTCTFRVAAVQILGNIRGGLYRGWPL